jgi:hypothetical protein
VRVPRSSRLLRWRWHDRNAGSDLIERSPLLFLASAFFARIKLVSRRSVLQFAQFRSDLRAHR